MKTIPFKVIGLSIVLLLSQSAAAQTVSFKRVETPEASPISGWISGITQDKQGYLWFTSSYGFHRYDGYRITTYVHDASNSNSLSPGNVETVYADRQGIIWIGTQFSGLDRFDPNTGVFTNFKNKPNDETSLSNNLVTAIIEDRHGKLWVGTNGGLNQLDRKTGKFIHYQHIPHDSASLSNDQVRVLYEDRQGTLWIGTGSPFFDESPVGGGGLNRMDKTTGKFTRYLNNPRDPKSLIDNRVRALFEDSHGTFWVGTFGDGLHTMDRQQGAFQRYPYDSKHPEKLSRPYLPGNPDSVLIGTSGSGISFITEASGDIWIGAHRGGLNRYNPITKKLTHFAPGSAQANGLQDQAFWSAFTTRDGVLFLGTCTGTGKLYSVGPSSIRLIHHRTPLSVSTFYEDRSGRLWLGSDKWLTIEDRKTGKLENIAHRIGLKQGDWIHLLFPDRQNMLWIGSQLGLIAYDETNQRTKHYRHEPATATSISSDSILAMHEDRQGKLWIGTADGLDLMDRKNDTFTHYRHDPSDSSTLSQSSVVDILEDKRENLWVITRWSWMSGSLNRIDRQTGKVIRYPKITDLVAMAEDAKCLWIASRNNLYRMDLDTKVVTRFIDPQTSESISAIQNLIRDKHGNLWVYTLNGLVQIPPSRDKVRRFLTSGDNHVTGGYQGRRNFYESRRGEVFFGNRTGYYSFFPEQLPPADTDPPQIVFHDFQLAGSSGGQDLSTLLRDPLGDSKTVELSYEQDAFSIGFAGIHYGQPELNKHLFQLEGYEKTWRQASSERTAYYYNIPPGRYNFRVKAANGDGVWAEKMLTILINPPWWRTWWAYTLYVMIFSALVAGFIKYRFHLQQEKLRLEKKDWETRQLKALDEMKTRFFSNITHEFRTPLSLILPATEQLIKELTVSDHQRRLSVIKRQARQLLHLINQLLDLAKLEGGWMLATEQHGDISAFTSQVVDSFKPAAEERGIILEFNTEVEPATWYFDADKWEKIINNLISNAVKFTPAGGQIMVTFRLTETDMASASSVTFTIEDNGPGIVSDKLPHIFDRFYQADNSRTRAFEGTGIGLALVKEMVELLNGHVRVESVLGKGTKFIVTLPISKGLAGGPVELVNPSYLSSESDFLRSTETPIEYNGENGNDDSLPLILIVEDHSDLREFIADSLCKSYRVLTAASGQQGLALTREHVPDVVISDVMMPEMDGFELTDLIKKDPDTNHIAVVLLTAKAAQESKLTGLMFGADDYLTKPFHFDELALRIRNIIGRQRKLHHRYQQQLKLDTAPLVETVQDKFWQSLCDSIEAQLDNPVFDVDALAASINISRRTLYRKLATLTGLKPNEVIRDYRLKRAKQFLSLGYSVSESGYRVGFESPSYFGKCFKEAYQITPSEYIQEHMAQSQQ